jgi:hypothetical protein
LMILVSGGGCPATYTTASLVSGSS